MKPAGWPVDVPDPEDPAFTDRAVAWLLDLGPAEWRTMSVVREQPVLLAFRAHADVRARLEGARATYSSARADLGDTVTPQALEAFLSALEAEGAALIAREREVGLVEEALRGRRWRPRL